MNHAEDTKNIEKMIRCEFTEALDHLHNVSIWGARLDADSLENAELSGFLEYIRALEKKLLEYAHWFTRIREDKSRIDTAMPGRLTGKTAGFGPAYQGSIPCPAG